MTNPDLLQQAIQAIESGDDAAGRQLLTRLVRIEPRNAHAWLWLSQVVPRQEHQLDCLLRVLSIEPENELALTKLAQLGRAQTPAQSEHAAPPRPPPMTTQRRQIVPQSPARRPRSPYRPHQDIDQEIAEQKKKRGYRNIMLAVMMLLSAACGIVLIVITITVIKPRAEKRLKPTPEPVLYTATLWCLPCDQAGSQIVLWEKVGDGISRGGQVGALPHDTTVSVLAEVWSAPEERTYFKVTAEGQTGWVPETFIKQPRQPPD